MTEPSTINVEVIFATPERQDLLSVDLVQGSTVADAAAKSGVLEGVDVSIVEMLTPGIWGRLATMDQVLKSGDRVEFYRPLLIDPRKARRELALLGKTMAEGSKLDPEQF